MQLVITKREDRNRLRQEQFVRKVFAAQYGADVRHFLPSLLGIEDQSLALQGVLGIHVAGEKPLFLEQYLNQQVELELSVASGCNISREGVVEVGNLAAQTPGGARLLIVMLTAFLHGADYQWVTFTALPALINSFGRLGIQVYPLADADPRQLEDHGASWGSYYEGGPKVVAVNVADSYKALECAAVAERLKAVMIWNQAYDSGAQLCTRQYHR